MRRVDTVRAAGRPLEAGERADACGTRSSMLHHVEAPEGMTRQNEPAEQVSGRMGRRLAKRLLERAEQHRQVDWVEPAEILLAAVKGTESPQPPRRLRRLFCERPCVSSTRVTRERGWRGRVPTSLANNT
eukprot:scaffold11841_cov109-Isochrysis_galbana.AAC.1